jgi:hypothetical protein
VNEPEDGVECQERRPGREDTGTESPRRDRFVAGVALHDSRLSRELAREMTELWEGGDAIVTDLRRLARVRECD